MSHTPGPWKFDPDAFNTRCGGICNDYSVGSIRDEREGLFIAKIEGGVDFSDSRDAEFSNARLIAAAPELLQGCKDALGAFENNNAINWDDLRRAIEKAEGHA
jgi:hypothetical protein